jgi:hypothetical protein
MEQERLPLVLLDLPIEVRVEERKHSRRRQCAQRRTLREFARRRRRYPSRFESPFPPRRGHVLCGASTAGVAVPAFGVADALPGCCADAKCVGYRERCGEEEGGFHLGNGRRAGRQCNATSGLRERD